MSHAVSHRFLMREDIHLRPDILAHSDCRYEFLISAQSCPISTTRILFQKILVRFLKTLATGVGRGGGGRDICTLRHIDITFRIVNIRLGVALFCSPQQRRNFLSFY